MNRRWYCERRRWFVAMDSSWTIHVPPYVRLTKASPKSVIDSAFEPVATSTQQTRSKGSTMTRLVKPTMTPEKKYFSATTEHDHEENKNRMKAPWTLQDGWLILQKRIDNGIVHSPDFVPSLTSFGKGALLSPTATMCQGSSQESSRVLQPRTFCSPPWPSNWLRLGCIN